jgi:hypothetical protein
MLGHGQPFLHRKKGNSELTLGPSFGRTLIALSVLVVVVSLLISGIVKPAEIMQLLRAVPFFWSVHALQ